MPSSIIRQFESVVKTANGWEARCPAHDDHKRSLALAVKDGKILLRCFAGCDVNAIVAAKGLTVKDLFLEPSRTAPQTAVSVESLAVSKGLPLAALTRYGVVNTKAMAPADKLLHGIGGSDGIWIPYFNLDGSVTARTRLRTAHIAKDGSRWLGQFGSIQPYGLHDLADAKAQGILCLCEGESDYWTLREAKIPALGLPGAQMVKSLAREHLAGVTALYICQDSDAAGAAFVASIRQHVASWGLAGVYALVMPAGCKDVNDLYRKHTQGFSDAMVGLMTEASTKAQAAVREFSTAGDIYVLTVPEWGLRLELDQIRRQWSELRGELAISSEHGDLFRGTVNLSDSRKLAEFAGSLGKRTGLTDVDWTGLMNEFALKALKAERTAGAVVNLRDVALPTTEQTWNIDNFALSRNDATCIFGDGGTGKSLIAVYLAGVLARQGVKVLYIDAEWEASIHKERLVSLFGEAIPSVLYLEQRAALEVSAQQIRRHLIDHGIEYVVLDSVGLLTLGAPEESSAALGYSRAVRSFGVGSLSLAHIRKTQTGDTTKPQDQKPFGSVFYHNLFRRTYFVKADSEAATEGAKQIGVWNTKWNHRGIGQRPFGLTLREDGPATVIEATEIAEIASLAPSLPLKTRIREALKCGGPQTALGLADMLEANERSVRMALARDNGTTFRKIDGPDGASWILA